MLTSTANEELRPSTPSPHDPSTNPNLDFLRAVAVVLVILDHTMLAFNHPVVHGLKAEWLGLAGVWMFFVHTALVLMWSLERRPYTLDFYLRRIFRIYPLSCAAILIVVLTHARVTGYGHALFDFHPFSRGNAIAAGLLVYNFVPGYTPIEYVIWTLPLEVDMYVLLPVLFAFARRERRLFPLLLGWLLAVAIARPFDDGMQFLTAIPNFLPGIMAFVLFKTARRRLPFWSFPVFLAALLAAVMAVSKVSTGWVFCLLLGCGLPYFHSLRSVWLQKISHTMAKYSYGAYIAHPFALLFGVYLLRGHDRAAQLSVELLSIAVISVAAYHLIERPMMYLGARLTSRLRQNLEMSEI